jgi:hypothetical protein
MEPLVVRTMAEAHDDRLPEQELVITIFTDGGCAALPFRELYEAGGLLVAEVGGRTLATISHGPGSALAGTFEPRLADDRSRAVGLELRGGRVVDRHTGSVFRADGLAVGGPLEGRRLLAVPTMINKWHSLGSFLPGVAILEHRGEAVPIDDGALAGPLGCLREAGCAPTPCRRFYDLELPHGAEAGLCVHLQGDPFEIFLFEDEDAADDYRLCRSHTLKAGRVVLASAPSRFADVLNCRLLPDDELVWSKLLGDERLQQSLRRADGTLRSPAERAPISLHGFVTGLRAQGVSVLVRRACYRDSLPVGARTGVQIEIEGDPFLLYRFDSAETAERHDPDPAHGIRVGRLVLRSDPADLYRHVERATGRRADAEVSWSPLLTSESFAARIRSVVPA